MCVILLLRYFVVCARRVGMGIGDVGCGSGVMESLCLCWVVRGVEFMHKRLKPRGSEGACARASGSSSERFRWCGVDKLFPRRNCSVSLALALAMTLQDRLGRSALETLFSNVDCRCCSYRMGSDDTRRSEHLVCFLVSALAAWPGQRRDSSVGRQRAARAKKSADMRDSFCVRVAACLLLPTWFELGKLCLCWFRGLGLAVTCPRYGKLLFQDVFSEATLFHVGSVGGVTCRVESSSAANNTDIFHVLSEFCATISWF